LTSPRDGVKLTRCCAEASFEGKGLETDVREVRVRPKQSWFDRWWFYRKLVEGWGKVRRFLLTKFRPGYVRRMRKLRRGECVRCGSCCAIMFKCPHLQDGNHCTIYERRYKQCDHFPIDHRDLRYREETCGHYFVREET